MRASVRNKILAIPQDSIFLRRDVALLEKHFNVRTAPHFNRKKPITTLPSVFKILKGTLSADLTFSWFASMDAFWAVLFSNILKKKSVVVACGDEVSTMPEIRFAAMGATVSRWTATRLVKFILKHATKLLAISEFNTKELLRYVESEKVRLVYLSVDSDEFKAAGKKQRNLVITTSEVAKSHVMRKGIETFTRSARFLPEVDFVLIGRHEDDSVSYLKAIATSNVKFTGYVSLDKLIDYYRRANVYVQVSAHEAFGVALAEAMLCECVPVVTNRGAIPEVVGDTGFYVPYGDPEATAEAVKKALNADGKMARERIVERFPLEKREADLVRIINELI